METKLKNAYDAGYDCGINGPNETNCHFNHFATPEQTKQWEAGKAAASKSRSFK